MSVARLAPIQGDDTYAWRMRKVVDLPWIVVEVDGGGKVHERSGIEKVIGVAAARLSEGPMPARAQPRNKSRDTSSGYDAIAIAGVGEQKVIIR